MNNSIKLSDKELYQFYLAEVLNPKNSKSKKTYFRRRLKELSNRKMKNEPVHPQVYTQKGSRFNPNNRTRFGEIPSSGKHVYFWRKNGGEEWAFACTSNLRRTAHSQFYNGQGKIGRLIDRKNWTFGYICYDSRDTCNASLDEIKEYFGDRCVYWRKYYPRKTGRRTTHIPGKSLADVKDRLNGKIRSY